jgi:SAM-dependent methyltransferase
LDERAPQAHTAALSAVLPNLQHERSSFRETALSELICYFKTNAGAAFEGCGPAVSRLLRKYGSGPKVLDLAIGDAAELSYMKDDGWDVFGNDIDAVQVERARMRFGAEGDDRIFCGDWRDLGSGHVRQCYDAAYLVGNSLCYLRTLDEHRSVLRQFFDVLKPGGLLVIDSRNYDKIFRLQDHILEDPVRNFQFSYMQAYTGDMQALVYPVAVDGQIVTLELAVPAKRLLGRLQVYGCRKREMEQLFEQSEFILEDTYFDCRWGLSEEFGHYDYVTWVLRKPIERDRREH